MSCTRLGYTLGRSVLAAAVAAGLMLIDERGMTAIVWIPERATPMACVMGGIALLLAYRLPRGGARRTAALAGIAALLLGAALSKEYGMAFAAATAAVGLVTRPGDREALVAVALAAVTVFAAMRALLPADAALAASDGAASGGNGLLDKCDYIGFLGHGENVCYGELDLIDRLLRWGWNAGATLVATFLPPLFDGTGAMLLPEVLAGPLGEADDYAGFSFASLILPLFVSVCAFVGLRRHPRAVLPLFALIVANAALNFLLFRDRNQVVGMIGLYAAAAVGLPSGGVGVAHPRAGVRAGRPVASRGPRSRRPTTRRDCRRRGHDRLAGRRLPRCGGRSEGELRRPRSVPHPRSACRRTSQRSFDPNWDPAREPASWGNRLSSCH